MRRVVLEAGQTATIDAILIPARFTQSVVVTARRVEEVAQEVPIPVSVVRGDLIADAGAFNVNRLKEMLPTVQFYSTNPRNSSINIRGLGSPFGLTNDGIEPGVGLYIDGVFYARPASATLDFLDVDQVEVLRGPQGTLFGKNTTAGAINVTTRKPSFTPGTEVELNYGNLGFVQAKASVTGPLGSKKLAGRLSFSGTQRDGTLLNTRTQDDVNDLNNLGFRGQVLFAPSGSVAVTVTGDHTRQRPEGFTQVVAGVAPTLRPANRQYAQIAASIGYVAPSFNAFDRVTDVDTPMRSYQDLGGASVNVDWTVGKGRLTSTTAWRFWDWKPSNDRDFIGVPVTSISAAPSYQEQWTQEVRYAAVVSPRLNYVTGAFFFRQALDSDPSFKQEQGSAAAAFLLAPSANASTPGLLDGYGFNQYLRFRNVSAATFGQVEWTVTDRLRVLPGLRFNYDQKDVVFDQQVYGGLQTTECRADRAAAIDPRAAELHGRCRRHQPVRTDDRGLQGHASRQRVRDLCDRLQVGRPQPQRRAHRRGRPARALCRDRQAGGCASRRDRAEDRAAARRHGEPHRVQHRDQGFPGAGGERGCRRAARLSRQCREGARARRRVRRQRPGEQARFVLRECRLHRRHVHLVPGRAAAARRHRRSAVQGRLGLGASRHLEVGGVGRRRVRQSRARCSDGAGSSSARSTPAIALRSRRARAPRGIWSWTAIPW